MTPDFVYRWPWEILVYGSTESRTVPRFQRRLGPLSGIGARTITSTRDPAGGRTASLASTPGRELRLVGIASDTAIASGTRVELVVTGEGGELRQTTTLTRDRPADAPIACDTSGLGSIRDLAPPLTLGARLEPDHAGEIRFVLRSRLPQIEMVAPAVGHVLPPRSALPVLRWRDEAGAAHYEITVVGDGPVFRTLIPPFTFPIPSRVAADGMRESTFLADLDPKVWQEWVDAVRAEQPDIDGFWIRLQLVGKVGNPGWFLSRSVSVPIKVSF